MGLHVSIDLTGTIADHVRDETGEGGGYADPADYIRDLIRRDMTALEQHQFRTVREHLQAAFAAPESSYVKLDADEFLRQIKSKRD